MSGGLLQLYSYGPQLVFLTNDPQITYFKLLYRRHTNFAIQRFDQELTQTTEFGNSYTTKIQKIGDLISTIYLKIKLSSVIPNNNSRFAWTRFLGHAIIKQIRLTIGGITVDTQYGIWLDIWINLSGNFKHKKNYRKLIGDTDILTDLNNNTKPEYTLFIPLQFWFNRHIGLALPMIALHYYDVYIKLELAKKEELIIYDDLFTDFDQISIISASYLISHIYLDSCERRRFATNCHEYLIEQVQYNNFNVVKKCGNYNLALHNLTKELFWVIQDPIFTTNKKFLCYTNKCNWEDAIKKCTLELINQSSNLGQVPEGDNWEVFNPGVVNQKTINQQIVITNNSTKVFAINTNTLFNATFNMFHNIYATITISNTDEIMVDILSYLTREDISVSTDDLTDCRICSDDIHVNQPLNYGEFITYQGNNLINASLYLNNNEFVTKRDANFFTNLQQYMYHSNLLKDGINVHSFALFPELLQPSGYVNMTVYDKIILDADIKKPSNLSVFALSYNILKIGYGFAALEHSY